MKQSHLYHSKIIGNKVKLNESMIEHLEYHNPDRNIVLTLGLEKCILIYPARRWKVIEARLLKMPTLCYEVRLLQRVLLCHMHKGYIAKSGVIELPNVLIKSAELYENISILEMNNKIEIWNKDNFENEIELVDGKKRYKLYRFINES